ncbi:MAG TPA: hypothetical protein VKJ01_23490, partial [Candidatus Solibacter sp.]|nr:hypothetical protein [Candidatus Solibacter sp.]
MFLKTEYWDQLPSLSSESKREASHGALFAPGLSLWIFSRDTLFRLYNAVSYPGPRAISADTVRQECDERTGKHRENEAGEDRDPLQEASARISVAIVGRFLLRGGPGVRVARAMAASTNSASTTAPSL